MTQKDKSDLEREFANLLALLTTLVIQNGGDVRVPLDKAKSIKNYKLEIHEDETEEGSFVHMIATPLFVIPISDRIN